MDLNIKKIKQPKSLSDMAYETLKASLLKMDIYRLPDDGKLDERDLAEKLGVSRTPLREAISRLVMEGFLSVAPRRGIYVVRKSKEEIIEILIVRSALEGMAARLAAVNATAADIAELKAIFAPFDSPVVKEQFLEYSTANVDFHELVLKLSGCRLLIDMANNLHEHMRWIRFRSAMFDERLPSIHREHGAIINAIENGEEAAAERLMREHIEGLAEFIDERGDNFL
ncbi:MAG: GntR family transcriptional regulator [Spirochaetae bacterium HGW-Spirochaetae-1]|jgi:DNA-binding GntR family transcriptional regulator|nr:MAG: GntR family transcriptional regulator [Spirochaetae bacterium HGW-Spirochaetae-1]